MSIPFNAILFDLGGVILNLDYNLTINAFKKLGEENFDRLYTQSQQDKIFDQFETGKISSAEFVRYMKQFLDPSTTDAAIEYAWNAMLLDLPVHRIQLLQQLKKKYSIFLFSNTNEIHLKAFRQIIEQEHGDADLLESLFHQTYYSHLVGERKPNAAAFRTVLDQHNLVPEKTLFIDDSLQHIEGAGKLGIQTIHLVNKDIRDLNLL
ncbi:MAG: HAD family phosphatase [Bacteroidetes bacterium]|nr:HAD family phosphatase [Bacteroidota bacterium]